MMNHRGCQERIFPVLLLAVSTATLLAQTAPPAGPSARRGPAVPAVAGPAAPKPPPFARLPNGDIRLGKIVLHRKERTLTFPATLALRQGALEVLIATTDGRTYESLLSTEAQPLHLQTLLYLLGLENGPRDPGPGARPTGDRVDIEVEWTAADGKKRQEPVEDWVCDNRTGKAMRRLGWVFVGSSFLNGQCLADIGGNVALLYTAGETVLETADPRSADDTIFSANAARIGLKPGAPVTVVVKLRARPPRAPETRP